MGIGGIAKRSVGQLAHHRGFQYRHDFAALDAEHSSAENLMIVGVHNGFHESARFVDLQGARNRRHRQFCHTNVAALLARLSLGDADAAELRIDEDRIRNEAPLRRCILMFNQIRTNNSEVVVGNMGKRRATFDVAQSVNFGSGGLQVVVYFYESLLVCRDLRGGSD